MLGFLWFWSGDVDFSPGIKNNILDLEECKYASHWFITPLVFYYSYLLVLSCLIIEPNAPARLIIISQASQYCHYHHTQGSFWVFFSRGILLFLERLVTSVIIILLTSLLSLPLHPGKLNMEPQNWGLKDDVPFQFGWLFRFQPFLFRGVRSLNYSHLRLFRVLHGLPLRWRDHQRLGPDI